LDLRVAAKPFAALETAVALPDGSTFLDRALQKHVPFAEVYRAYCRNMGRPGSSAAGRLLVAAADRADSAAERLLVRLLREAGIGGWVLGHRLGPYLIDLAFPAQRVAIEVDGWAYHVDPERFRNDRRKGNFITRRGWDLLRFTWHGLHTQPGGVDPRDQRNAGPRSVIVRNGTSRPDTAARSRIRRSCPACSSLRSRSGVDASQRRLRRRSWGGPLRGAAARRLGRSLLASHRA
jgi:very-short-patch-repair endonuclease